MKRLKFGAHRWLSLGATLLGLLTLGCNADSSGSSGVDGGKGRPNDAGLVVDPCAPLGLVPGVCPSRGVYSESVEVTLTAPLDKELRYTLDGSLPTQESALYSSSLIIEGSVGQAVVPLRIATLSEGTVLQTTTHSYAFADRVLDQPAAPSAVPSIWGPGDIQDQDPGDLDAFHRLSDYEMDPDVLSGDARQEALAALSSLPTVFLTLSHEDLWSSSGLYMNPELEGEVAEKEVSFEYVAPGEMSVQTQSGIRIQGGSSQLRWKSAKLSMRIFFRKELGDAKLSGRVFPDSEVTEFNTMILDAHLNQAYTHPDHGQRRRTQLLRDRFMSDLHNSMGGLSPHGRFAHLFLNGMYWGLYEMHERPDEDFTSAYLGGDKDSWDAIKHRPESVLHGDNLSYLQLLDLVRGDASDPAIYGQIQSLLDIDAFIDYMLLNFYGGNTDWPHHNWYAARSRIQGGFTFFSWDAEHSLKSLDDDRTGVNATGSPGEIYQGLLKSDVFQSALQRRMGVHFAEDGAFAPSRTQALYGDLAATIEDDILLELARWGDNQADKANFQMHSHSEWKAERDSLLDDYFPARRDRARAQLP